MSIWKMPYTYRNVVFFCSIYAYLLNLICPINYHNYHIFKIIVRLNIIVLKKNRTAVIINNLWPYYLSIATLVGYVGSQSFKSFFLEKSPNSHLEVS